MMKLNINGGSMEITDDNQTLVSQNIANEINNNLKKPDLKDKDEFSPVLTIKD